MMKGLGRDVCSMGEQPRQTLLTGEKFGVRLSSGSLRSLHVYPLAGAEGLGPKGGIWEDSQRSPNSGLMSQGVLEITLARAFAWA